MHVQIKIRIRFSKRCVLYLKFIFTQQYQLKLFKLYLALQILPPFLIWMPLRTWRMYLLAYSNHYFYWHTFCYLACQEPDAPENGNVMVTRMGLRDYAIYTCNTNFTIRGPSMRQCGTNGEYWNGSDPTCGVYETFCFLSFKWTIFTYSVFEEENKNSN